MKPKQLQPFEKELFNLITKYYGDPQTPYKNRATYNEVIKSTEKVMLIYALIKRKGVLVGTAETLGLNRNTIHRLVSRESITPKWFVNDTLFCPRIALGIPKVN